MPDNLCMKTVFLSLLTQHLTKEIIRELISYSLYKGKIIHKRITLYSFLMFSVLSKNIFKAALCEDNLKEKRLLMLQLSQFFLESTDTKIIPIR